MYSLTRDASFPTQNKCKTETTASIFFKLDDIFDYRITELCGYLIRVWVLQDYKNKSKIKTTEKQQKMYFDNNFWRYA